MVSTELTLADLEVDFWLRVMIVVVSADLTFDRFISQIFSTQKLISSVY